jgi:hypothetical protein
MFTINGLFLKKSLYFLIYPSIRGDYFKECPYGTDRSEDLDVDGRIRLLDELVVKVWTCFG